MLINGNSFYMGRVKRKSAFEHAQNPAHTQGFIRAFTHH